MVLICMKPSLSRGGLDEDGFGVDLKKRKSLDSRLRGSDD